MIACNSKSTLKRSELLEISAETGLSSWDLTITFKFFFPPHVELYKNRLAARPSVYETLHLASLCRPRFYPAADKNSWPHYEAARQRGEESEWESMKWYLVWVFVLCWLWPELGWLTGTQPHSEFITKVKGQYEGKRGKVRGRRRRRQTGNTL